MNLTKKYHNTGIEPNNFRSQIKSTNLEIRIKNIPVMNFSIQIKESRSTLWTTLQEDNQNNDHSIIAPPV